MKLVVLITVQIENGLAVAQAWQDAGAPGVTILRSYGLQNLRLEAQRSAVELPRVVLSMARAMTSVIDSAEQNSEIIFSIVGEQMVDTLIDIAHDVLDDLYAPDNGVLFVLDIERAVGIRRPNN
jgi:nitrogen regulatory protein PII